MFHILQIPSLLLHYIILIAYFFLIYIIGKLLYHFIKHDDLRHESFFFELVIGFVALSAVTALFSTYGQTILLLLIIPLLYWYLSIKKPFSKIFIDKSLLITGVIISIPYYIYSVTKSGVNSDYFFYSEIAFFDSKYGIESSLINFFSKSEQTNTPYHYGDIWQIVSLTKIFGINPLRAYEVILFPLSWMIAFFGGLAICNVLKKPLSIVSLILCFLIPAIAPLDEFTSLIPKLSGDTFNAGLINLPKVYLIYIFILASIIHLLKESYLKTLYCLLIIPLVYSPVCPSVLTTIFVYALFLLLTKKIQLKDFIKLLLSEFVIAALLVSFYYFIQNKSNIHVAGSSLFDNEKTSNELFNYYCSSLFIKTTLNIVIGCFLKSFIGLIFFFIFFKPQKSHINLYIFIGIGYFIPLFIYAISHPIEIDTVQFWYNFSTPLLSIFCFLVIVMTLADPDRSIIIKFSMILIIGMILKERVSTSINLVSVNNYFAPASLNINKDQINNLGYFRLQKASDSPFLLNPKIRHPYPPLFLQQPHNHPTNLSVLELVKHIEGQKTLASKRYLQKAISTEPLYLFSLNTKPQSTDKVVAQFIEENNIKNIFLIDGYPLPLYLKNQVKQADTIDSKTILIKL